MFFDFGNFTYMPIRVLSDNQTSILSALVAAGNRQTRMGLVRLTIYQVAALKAANEQLDTCIKERSLFPQLLRDLLCIDINKALLEHAAKHWNEEKLKEYREEDNDLLDRVAPLHRQPFQEEGSGREQE